MYKTKGENIQNSISVGRTPKPNIYISIINLSNIIVNN